METYSQRDLEEVGIRYVFVQDNQSASVKGTLRGLHFQKNFPQTKLIRVIRGVLWDVAVDLRQGSPTFGQHYGVELSAENKKQLLIPRGFAHGFLALSDAEICYKCDDFYHPEDEGGLAWNDPALAISWPGLTGPYRGTASAAGYTVYGTPLRLSEKDQKWPGIKELAGSLAKRTS